MPKLLTILGARPQFIKAAALTRAIAKKPNWSQDILHTGQHYDASLSKVFFDTLDLPEPRWQFTLSNSSRPERMEEMRNGIQKCIAESKPDAILVYGDTDSTLAGAQVANANGIKLIHVEAGLRSFDLDMPEEVNRIETDKLADILVAPTHTAIANLENEGIYGAFLTGDIMHDNALHFSSAGNSEDLDQVLLTMHRPSNVDDVVRIESWLKTIGFWASSKGLKVVFPIHPRTRKGVVEIWGKGWVSELQSKGIEVIDPVGYVELLALISSSKMVVTDSGGIQKESYSCSTPSVVIRHNTEWVELLENGCAALCPEPSDFEVVADKQFAVQVNTSDELYGDGNAAESILDMLSERLDAQTVILFHPNPTPRMRYGAQIIFNTCLRIAHSWENAGEAHEIMISFGEKSLTAPIHAISLSQDDQALSSGVRFPCEVLGVTDLNFDPLASAVFLAAQWEDVYNPDVERDSHHRSVGRECSKPQVELMARDLAEKLGIIPKTSYSYQPTIDVDVAFAFKGRSAFVNLMASLRDLVTLRWGNLGHRIKTIKGGHDPYDTYDWIDDIHSGLGTRAFFLRAGKGKYDVGLNPSIVDEVIMSKPDWNSSWHPSYKAMTSLYHGDGVEFKEEMSEFPLCGTEVRAHYLRSDARVWAKLVEMGVTDDYSLGYANYPGFRSGLCRQYPAFDLKQDKVLQLTIHPVTVMDSSLKSYMGLSPEEGVDLVKKLNEEVRAVEGQMITLFHNTSVSDYREWKGWKKAYVDIVELCS